MSRAVEENKWSKTWFNRSSFLWFFDLRNLRHFTPNETSWQPTHFTMQHSVEIILSENYVFTKNKFWISCIQTVKYLSFYKIESNLFYHYINQSQKRGFWLIGWIRFEVKSLHFDTIDARRPTLDRLMTMKLGTGFTKIVLQTTLKFFRAFFVRVEIAFNPYFCSEKHSFCNWLNFLGRKNLRLQTLTAP